MSCPTRLVEVLRTSVPDAVLPFLVAVRFRLAWLRAPVRADARRQMAFLLARSRPGADLEAAARAYVRQMTWRGELRWHPHLITEQRVEGFAHLQAAHDLGRGVVVNFMHHGSYDGLFPSLARLGIRSYILAFDHLFSDDTPGWLKQHVRVASIGGNTPISVAVGSDGVRDLLRRGLVVGLASDVPGRTPLRFAGHQVLGSSGAARAAVATGAPVVVATSELDASGRRVVRLHPPLQPTAFSSPQELLEEMVALHEDAVLRWPEGSERPLSRWHLAPSPSTVGRAS